MTKLPTLSCIHWSAALLCAVGIPPSAAAQPAGAPRVFHVRDFGAVADGKADASDGIRAAIAAAMASGQPAEVRLDAGSYRVRPPAPREACFAISQATNLTVRGSGKSTRIVITDPASGGFGFGICQQVSVRDLALDYDPVPFCQGTIRAVDGQGGDKGFFKSQAQTHIAHALERLYELKRPVTVQGAFELLSDTALLEEELENLADLLETPRRVAVHAHFTNRLLHQPEEQLGGVRETIGNYLQTERIAVLSRRPDSESS